MRFWIIFLFIPVLLSAEIIPSDRRVTWEGNVGISGGIPDSSGMTIYQTISAGASRSTVQTALNNCPSNQVVQLSAGTYSWSDTLDWASVANGVVLRGAGMGETVITWSGFSQTAVFFRRGFDNDAFDIDADLTADLSKGSTTITLASVPSWVTVGALIGIDMLDDTDIASEDGFNCRTVDCNTGEPRGIGERNISQLVRVTAKDATTITIEIPAYFDFTVAQSANIFQPGFDPSTSRPRILCGIEDLTLSFSFTGSADAHPILCYPMDRSWFKNIEIDNMPSGRGWLTYYAYRCEWRGNYVHDSHNFDGGQGYGIDLNDSSCANLVEDNIFEDLHATGAVIRYGSAGNVVAYNFCTNSVASAAAAQTVSMSTHGCHALMNLWEGNWSNDKVLGDFTHGSSSHNTVYRNVVQGQPWGSGDRTAVSIEYYNRYWNVVGNILGKTGQHNKRVAHSGSTAAGSQGTIFRMGGEVNINSDYSPADAWAYTSGMFVLDHMNYDVVTSTNSGVVWNGTDSSISDTALPDSLYLPTKPTFFGFLTWPPYTPTSPGSGTNSLSYTNIPAGYRFLNGTNPPAASSGGESGSAGTRGNKIRGVRMR